MTCTVWFEKQGYDFDFLQKRYLCKIESSVQRTAERKLNSNPAGKRNQLVGNLKNESFSLLIQISNESLSSPERMKKKQKERLECLGIRFTIYIDFDCFLFNEIVSALEMLRETHDGIQKLVYELECFGLLDRSKRVQRVK